MLDLTLILYIDMTDVSCLFTVLLKGLLVSCMFTGRNPAAAAEQRGAGRNTLEREVGEVTV